MILTDASGKPFPMPRRADFDSDVDYIRAFHAYKDAVTACANEAFDSGFRGSMAHVSEDYINRKYRGTSR